MQPDTRHVINDEVRRLIEQHYIFTHRGDENFVGAVLISSTVQRAYEAIAKRLLDECPMYRDRFAFQDVANRLRSVVTNTVKSGDYAHAEALMNLLWERLDNPDERKVCYVPFVGIKLVNDEVTIGKFRLQKMNDTAVEEAVQLLNTCIDNTAGSTEIKQVMKTQQSRELTAYLAGSVCLRIEVVADTEKADQIALRDAVTLLDFFRFTIPALYPKGNKVGVGLKGDGQPGIYQRYVLPVGVSDGLFQSYRTGPFGDLEIDQRAL